MFRHTRTLLPQPLQTGLTVLLCLSLLCAPLGALQPVQPQAAARSLHPSNFSAPQHFAFFLSFWSKLTSLLDPEAPNLNTLRNNTPALPDPYQPTGSLPGSTYDDPKPTITANYDSYLTQLSLIKNQAGPAGSLPMQIPDPTSGTASVGGVTVEMRSGQYNFSAPVVNLPGRAGNSLALALSYSSRIWTQGTAMAFNADRGFPAPGWRLGFGAIQIKHPSSGPFLSGTTGRNSIIYIEPSGVRHELRLIPETNVYESYDSSYINFDALAKIMYFPNGTQVKYGDGGYSYALNNYDYQALPLEIKDRNGNFTTIVYKSLPNEKVVIDYVIDTVGRRVDFYYENNRLLWIGQQRNGVWFYFVRLDYQPITIQTGMAAELLDPQTINGTQVWMVSRITYPTGANFRFAYNSSGICDVIQKWAPTISGQGGEKKVATTTFPFTSGVYSSIAGRNESAENWQGGAERHYLYSGSESSSSYYNWQVQDPTGRFFRFRLELDTLKIFSAIYAHNGLDVVKVKEDTTSYAKDADLSYNANLRVTEVQKTSDWQSVTASTHVTQFGYTPLDGMWLPTTRDERSYGGPVYRRTVTEYTNLPTQREHYPFLTTG